MSVLKTSLRNFFAHKGRMALSAIAVLLSVAFVSGTLVFTDTMNTTFDKLFASTASDVTVSPKDAAVEDGSSQSGRPESFPASLVEQVRKVEGVQAAQGAVISTSVTVVDAKNKNVGPTSGAPTIAVNWSANELRSVEMASGHEPRGPTEVVVDGDTAEKHGLKLGDELRTISVAGDFTARISGIAEFKVTNPGATVVYFETPTAQRELLGKEGLFTQITADAAPGVSDDALKRDIAASIGADYKLQTAAEAADAGREDVAGFLDVMKYAMLGFAGIAFLVGIFLIVNTFSMLVAQRTREIGLMRAIGSSHAAGEPLRPHRGAAPRSLRLRRRSRRGGRTRRRTDEAHVRDRHGTLHRRPHRHVDDPGRRPRPRHRRHRPRRLHPGPPRREDLPDGSAPRRGNPRRRQGRTDPRRPRPRPHRRRSGRARGGVPRRGSGPRLALARSRRLPLPPRLRRRRPAPRRMESSAPWASSSCGSSVRSAGWPSGTRSATPAAPAPRPRP